MRDCLKFVSKIKLEIFSRKSSKSSALKYTIPSLVSFSSKLLLISDDKNSPDILEFIPFSTSLTLCNVFISDSKCL